MIFNSRKIDRHVTVNEENRLVCQLSGNAELTLINIGEIDDKDSDFSNADVTPSLVVYRTSLKQGDCSLIPAKWVSTMSTSSMSLLISMTWGKAVSDYTDTTCGETSLKYLVSLNFRKDPSPDLLAVLKLHSLHHVIETYFLKNSEVETTFEQFINCLREDEQLAEITDWNDEFTSIAKEMFDQLDQNQDGALSLADIIIKRDKMERLAGSIKDRFEDFQDIAKDQVEEKKPIWQVAKDAYSKTEEDTKKMLAKEFEEIFKQIEEISLESEPSKYQGSQKEFKPHEKEKTKDTPTNFEHLKVISRDEL